MRTALVIGSLLFTASCVSAESDEMLPVSTTVNGTATTRTTASGEAARRSNGFIRFVQAVPEVNAVDVYSNDMRFFRDVQYGTMTPFREIGDASYNFRIRPAGDEVAVPIAEESEGIDEGKHYTIVAFREADEAKGVLGVFEDDLTPADAGCAKLRVINAAHDTSEIDVYTPGGKKALFTGLDYMKATDYAQIKPMNGQLAVHREDEDSALVTLPTTHFEVGRIYTVILIGRANGSPTLRAIVTEDKFSSP